MPLALLERRAVEDDEHVDVGGVHLGYGPAVLPDVLADDDPEPPPAHLDDARLLAGCKDPSLVEDAVIGQVVLGVPGDDVAVLNDDGLVDGAPVGSRTERPKDDGHLAHAVLGEARRDLGDRALGGALKRLAQGEVLDGVTRDDHLGKCDDVRPLCVGGAAVLQDDARVAGEIPDARVDLSEREAERGHGTSLRVSARPTPWPNRTARRRRFPSPRRPTGPRSRRACRCVEGLGAGPPRPSP